MDENDSDDGNTEPLILTERKRNRRSNSFSCYGLGVIDPALYGNCTIDLEEDVQFPDDHIGRLWFSVRYENATEKLLVSILKAKNLPSRTVGTVNGCDPFIRLHLLPDERRYQQSKVKKKSCNPFFDETFVFQVLNPTFPHLSHTYLVVRNNRTIKFWKIFTGTRKRFIRSFIKTHRYRFRKSQTSKYNRSRGTTIKRIRYGNGSQII